MYELHILQQALCSSLGFRQRDAELLGAHIAGGDFIFLEEYHRGAVGVQIEGLIVGDGFKASLPLEEVEVIRVLAAAVDLGGKVLAFIAIWLDT